MQREKEERQSYTAVKEQERPGSGIEVQLNTFESNSFMRVVIG
jgi:hypothetical protein